MNINTRETNNNSSSSRIVQNPLNKQCSNCNSDNTQSFQMVYAQGTSSGNFSGLSYNGDNVGMVGGKSTNQSVLASKIAPPNKPYFRLITIVFLSIFFFILTSIILKFVIDSLLTRSLIAVISTILFAALTTKYESIKLAKEQNIYTRELSEWQKSWLCLRCGSMWRIN